MEKDNIKAIYALSPLQEGMLYHKLYNTSDLSYHIQNAFWVDGRIDLDTIKSSLELLALRHEVFKTAFIIPQSTGRPWQVVLKNRNIEFIYEEHICPEFTYIDSVKAADLNRGFDLQNDSLMRLTVISFSENRHYFLFSFHHIIIDGWCVSLVYGDFLRYYELLNSGKSPEEMKRLVEREKTGSAEYRDYIKWLENQDKEKGLSYWRELLSDYEGKAEIRPVTNTAKGKDITGQLSFSLPAETTRKLIELSARQMVTINTIAETAWGILLQRYNNSLDVVFGKVVSGRNANVYGIDNTVGLFINTIPSRVKCEKGMTASTLFNKVQSLGEDSSSYDYCSLSGIQSLTPLGSDLIKTLFVFENYYMDKDKLKSGENGLNSHIESEREQTNYDVTISAHQDGDQFSFNVLYNCGKYQEPEMEVMFERLKSIFEQFAANPDIEIEDIDVISDAEREKILGEFNNTYSEYPEDKTVMELFEQQVEKTPDKTAVFYMDEKLNYRELNQRSNQLAYKLRKLGVQPDDFVAIIAKRSTEVVIGICGILKSGGAYVPIDSAYPEDRIKYVLKDCAAKVLLVYKTNIPDGIDIPVIDLADENIWTGEIANPQKVNKSTDLAYCIYTSGTTGESKGVLIEQKSVIKLVINQNYTVLDENTAVLQTGQLAFDASTFEIWGSILQGGRVHLISEELLLNFGSFKDYLIRNKINTLFITTALFNQMIMWDETIFDTLEHLMFGGEKTSEQCVDILKRRKTVGDFRNVYGPTETTTFASHYIIKDEKVDKTPIGRPISNTKIYILNNMKLCGIGIPGELCIAGPGLARGYLGRPELTAEKFVKNPFGEGRLYRSGDLVKWLSDGNIEYLGRIDGQVKIRGFRIELGEITAAIREISCVKDTAVIAHESQNGEKSVYAYIVSDENVDFGEIRKELRKKLPEYMIPAYMTQISEIPMTRNGKLDRHALPEIEAVSMYEYAAPGNDAQMAVIKAFETVLGVENIGIKESFFELGGDSIKAIRIVSKMREAGYEVSIKNIMEKYIIEAIADTAKPLDNQKNGYQGEVTGIVKPTPIIKQFASWNLKYPDHFNQDILIKVEEGAEQRIQNVLNQLAMYHDILRSVYRNGVLEILSIKESKLCDFKVINLKGENNFFEKIEEESTKLQSTIDLENGPLMKSALYKTNKGDYLFICLHHLAVDGVSWRILLEDFETGMKQLMDGNKIVFPQKTASYKEWSEVLEEYKDSSKFEKERKYWEKTASRMHEGVLAMEQSTESTGYGEIATGINEDETCKLVRKAGKAFNTEINDLLISALGMAARKLTGQAEITIGIEGHGREKLHRQIEVDRTVGWFTSIYPVVAECFEDIEESIVTTKEMLRNIPNHGIGYGLIKEELNAPDPDICFNYLGQMDAENREDGMKFCSTGMNCAAENSQFEGISINGVITGGVLTFSFTYSRRKYQEAAVKRFAELYVESLKACIEYCLAQDKTVRTASDYMLPELSMSDIKLLNSRFGAIEDMYPLAPLQEGMVYHSALDKEFSGYIIQHVISLHGKSDDGKIAEALRLLVKRHEILRTAIAYDGIARPVQMVFCEREAEYEKIDLTGLDEYLKQERITEIANADVKRGFNLQRDALIRVKHIILDENSSKMIWSYHHIIIDGWCMSIIYGDYIKYYNMLSKGTSIDVLEKIVSQESEKSPKYRHFLKWLAGQDKDICLNYWTELLADYEGVAEIKPMLKPEPSVEQVRLINTSLSETMSSKLTEMAASNNVTINTVAEAAWGITLKLYNHTNDVVFGKVVSGRNADVKGIESIVGLFINTIPLRVKCRENMTVAELLKECGQNGISANNYSYCSLAEIQGCTLQKNDLIKTLFVFENYYLDEERLNSDDTGLRMRMERNREQTNYPVSVITCFENGIFKLSILYDPNIFVKEEVEGILERTMKIMCSMIENPNARVEDIESVTDTERNKILGEFNNTCAQYPSDKTITDLFEEQVKKAPDNTAVVFMEEKLTYAELNKRSNILAYKLRELGIRPGDFVAIIGQRSAEIIIGIMGVLKAGAAYVPVDYTNPAERISYILKDCAAKVLLEYKADVPEGIGIPFLDLADSTLFTGECKNLPKVNNATDLAYCIYTSGTTGQPKGVMIEHYGVVNLREYFITKQNATSEDRILQFANFSFDAVISELCLSILNGAALYMLQEEIQKDFMLFEEFLLKNKISIAILPPQYLSQLDISNSCLRTVITAGSETSSDIVRRNSCIDVYSNDYGPTEATVCATYWKHKSSEQVPDRIPIGRPINNKQIYILDGMKLCGIGIPGELCIAGPGLARGYLGMPELTSEKFIKNPFGEGRLYRSGDLARWLPDGNIEYLGRIDEQVKIRGFRIELGEITAALRVIKCVKDAVIITRENQNGDKAIYAYIVSDENVDLVEIRNELGKYLPEYIIPQYMTRISEIPMTRNGKLDKRALPEIEAVSIYEYVPPRNEAEKAVCKAFETVLGVERAGIKESFFELGGDSIKAIRIVSKMRESGYEVSIKDIMEKHTVEAIADTAKKPDGKKPGYQGEVTGIVNPTPIIKQFTSWNLKNPGHFNQDILIKVEKGAEQRIQKVLNELAMYHDVLRSVYRNRMLEILSIRESKLCDFNVINLKDETGFFEKIEEECTKLQSTIDLGNGPLMRSALFKTGEGDYLFVCLHHLIVDGVSWRILLEDFETGMKQLKEGNKIVFPLKTASYKEWSEALEEYKGSLKLKKERKYWEKTASKMHEGVLALAQSTEGSGYGEITISMDEYETSKLVRKAGKAFNTEVNDLLISALCMAVRKLTGQAEIAIGIEGHGREKLHRQIEVDRTVGWFTSIYPVVAECFEDIEESIVTAKEMLRNIPNHGIGYGLIKEELNASEPDICFNYLGQMDAENSEDDILFCRTGSHCDPENSLFEGIGINGVIAGGVLTFSFTYGRMKYSDEVVKSLAELYMESLKACMEYCLAQNKTVKTASDYLLPELAMADIKLLHSRFGGIEDIYPLTPLQEGMLYHNMDNDSFTGHIIQHVVSLNGKSDEEKIVEALKLLVKRHAAFRTAITYNNIARPVQVVFKDREAEYETIDLTGLDEPEQNKRILEIANADVKRGFNLQDDTLIRVKHIILDKQNSKMIWSYHHIIIDGWCMSLVYGDYINYYNMLAKGTSMDVLEKQVREESEKSPKYREYLKWLADQDKDSGLNYWNELLADYEEVAEIRPMLKPEACEEHVSQVDTSFSEDMSKKLIEMAASNNVTINTVAEAAWGITLKLYNHTNDVVFGKVVSGRNADVRGIEGIVGLFINTIPVRVKCRENITVAELIKEVQQNGISANNYSYCSLAEIQGCTIQKNDLIKALFVFENYYLDEERLKSEETGLQMKMETGREQTTYPICVTTSFENGVFKLSILYDPNLYVKEDIEGILERTMKIMSFIIENPNARIEDIEAITDTERNRILGEFNDTYAKYPTDKTIMDLFEEQVKEAPDNTALVFMEEKLTYAELNKRSNQLAYKLREAGVKPDDFVAIIGQRSAELVIGICGILKAGGAYVPINTSNPAERINYILKDCGAKALLKYKAEVPQDIGIPIIDLEDSSFFAGEGTNPPKVNKPKDLAYCIYTSGTTGLPKGVMIEQESVIKLVINADYTDFNENTIMLQTAQIAFDASTFEIWGCLLNGGRVHLIDEMVLLDFAEFKRYMTRHNVNTLFLTTALFNRMINYDAEIFDSLKYLMFGGEKASEHQVDLLRKRNININFTNLYGPTETTTLASHYRITGKPVYRTPIGKPISNTQLYVLDGMKLCGIGIPGELCIAGPGLARGYLGKPDLTAKAFVDNPYGEGRLYRSGDLVRWLPDGNIEYIGRIDEQVKVRGFRIELEEIESIFRKIDYIKDVAVITRVDNIGENTLCAYIVSDREISIYSLKETLGSLLPEYMIPSYITQLERLPVTGNGKLDKRALPQPDVLNLIRKENRLVEAQSDYEKELALIWQGILNIDEIGVYDNFFELGGNSLLLIKMQSQIEAIYPNCVKVGDIFANPTIKKLAGHIELKNHGTLYCEDIPFPEDYFNSSISTLKSNRISIRENGALYDKMRNMHDSNETEFHATLLFAYCYLLYNITGQNNFTVCEAGSKKYCSFDFDMSASDDLNECKDSLKRSYEKAQSYSKVNIKIQNRQNGIMPIFLYKFEENDCYKDFSDFAVAFSIEPDGITFKVEVFNRKLANEKIFAMLEQLIRMLGLIF